MHKKVILLTQAEDKDEAKRKAETFMNSKSEVCDWYTLGGRFSNNNDDDILPIVECEKVLKDYIQNPITEGNKLMKQAEGYKEKKDYVMFGYVLEQASSMYQEKFFDETNVYNIDEEDYSIPKDFTGWYAVVIDMHY